MQTQSPTLDTDQVFNFEQDEVIFSEWQHEEKESKFSEELLNRQQINCEIDKVLFSRASSQHYFPEDSVDQIIQQVNYQASMKDLIHRIQQRAKYRRSFTSKYIMLQLLNFKKQK